MWRLALIIAQNNDPLILKKVSTPLLMSETRYIQMCETKCRKQLCTTMYYF